MEPGEGAASGQEAGKAEAGEGEADGMETHSLAARDPLIGPEVASAEHPRAPRVSAISFLFPSLSATQRARKKKRHLVGSSQKYQTYNERFSNC